MLRSTRGPAPYAVTESCPGVRIHATEERPDASGNVVINADLVFHDDLAPGVGRHQ